MPTIINHQSSNTTAEGKVRLFWYISPIRIVQHLSSSSQSVNLNLQAVLYGGPNRLLIFSVSHLPLSPSHPLIPVVICKLCSRSFFQSTYSPSPLPPCPYPTLPMDTPCGSSLFVGHISHCRRFIGSVLFLMLAPGTWRLPRCGIALTTPVCHYRRIWPFPWQQKKCWHDTD